MSSYKEPHHSRASSQQRPMPSTTPMNVPNRHTGPRNHSHSLSLGTINTTHRVTRRKSMTANNFSSVAAAMQNIDDVSLEALVSPSNTNQTSKNVATLTPGAKQESQVGEKKTSADIGNPKVRSRRASEGGYLNKNEGKRVSGELKCETCGKGYKHSSCLTKHLWEHTPEWKYTSKLLISKHQQVQLLEAASVLVSMNQSQFQDQELVDSLKIHDSDHSSSSPAASGSSEMQDDGFSSVETTPPPLGEGIGDIRDPKRYSSSSSIYSRSYQSGPSASLAASSVPTSTFGSYHQGFARRPSTSGSVYNGISTEDEAGLAAAVELCNFGTPRTGPVPGDDIPPVPPLPARYVSHKATPSTGSNGFALNHQNPIAPSLTSRISDERDVKMQGHGEDGDSFDDRPPMTRTRSDEYDEGVFGHMEE